MVNVRQGQFQTPLDVLGNEATGNLCIPLLQGAENCAMNLIRFFEQFAIVTESFNSKDSRVNVTVTCQLGEARIASGFNDRHVK